MKIADDLSDRPFDAKKFVGKKVIDLDRLVFVQPLGAWVISVMDAAQPAGDDHVVNPGVRHLRNRRVLLDQFEIIEQRPAPLFSLAGCAVRFDYLLKRTQLGHQLTPWLDKPVSPYVNLGEESGWTGVLCFKRIPDGV